MQDYVNVGHWVKGQGQRICDPFAQGLLLLLLLREETVIAGNIQTISKRCVTQTFICEAM